MVKTPKANIVKDKVFVYIDNLSRDSRLYTNRDFDIHDIVLSALWVLYGIHKGYTVSSTYYSREYLSFINTDDKLLDELEVSFTRHIPTILLIRLYEELLSIPEDTFNLCYVEVLQSLFSLDATKGKKDEEFYTPQNVTRLLGSIINREKCKSIFDPFCGTASVVNSVQDKDIYFAGQELQKHVVMYAKIILDACGVSASKISNANSIVQWNENHFDAVVSCPPFNYSYNFKDNYGESFMHEFGYEIRTLEHLFFIRAFKKNRADVVISLEPLNFCFSRQLFDLRREIIKRNLLDEIYFLPEKVLFGTSIPCIIVVCKRNRDINDPVKLYNAQSYYKEGRKGDRQFDVNRFLKDSNLGNSSIVTHVRLEEFSQYDYNWNLPIYEKKNLALKEGQKVKKLSEILVPANYSSVSKKRIRNVVSQSKLSRDLVKIMLNTGNLFMDSSAESPRMYNCIEGESYLVYTPGNCSLSRYGLITEPCSFVCGSGVKVMKIKTEEVSPEYLAYLLINSDALKKSFMSLSNCLNLPVVVDSIEEQRNVISSIKLEYAETMRLEQIADAQRLGVKQNISDIEHMLSSTTMKINRIISRLEKMTPDSSEYAKTVKELKDRFGYMNRTIHYANENLDDTLFSLQEGNLLDFLEQYADGWNNYGGGYFDLSIKNNIIDNVNCAYDAAMCTVMLDSILTNAVRHSFLKEKNHTEHNMVEICLSLVEYQEKPFILMSISNNGEPLKKGFSVKDYITKGRYSGKMGRSGLGGYHVYKIAKGHNGFLCLDSNKVWSMIVEILIPANNVKETNLKEYEHECI